MKLKVTLRRPRRQAVDLLVSCDTGATVGDVAAALAARDPKREPGEQRRWTLEIAGGERVVLDPALAVASSGVMSGATVSLVAADELSHDPHDASAAVLRVVEGPDAGRDYRLGRGTNVIGRAAGCAVRLSDTSVSREHAKLVVTDTAEIVDAGSSNGISVGGGLVSRATLNSRDQVRLGDTVFVVEVTSPGVTAGGGACVPYNRSPRLEPAYPGHEVVVPDPPPRPQPGRLPVLSLIAPVVFGAVVYSVTRSAASLAFIALSPLMAIANVAESRRAGRRAFETARDEWRAELAELREAARAAETLERARRLAAHPSTGDVCEAIQQRTPLLWSRRPDGERFLQVRVGRGARPSRTTVKRPSTRQSDKRLWHDVESLAGEFRDIADVPVVADLRTGPLGVAAAGDAGRSVASAVLLQVVGLHSPAEVVVAGLLSSGDVDAWDWLKWLPHTSSPHSPLASHLAVGPAGVATVVAELESLVDAREAGATTVPAVVVLADDAAASDRSRLVALAERGTRSGVHVVWRADSVELLPAGCAAYVAAHGASADGVAGFTADGTAVTPLRLERLTDDDARLLARRLAPVVDAGAPVTDDSSLPSSVSWLALHERSLASAPNAVIERWRESRSVMTGHFAQPPSKLHPGSLRAVVGAQAADEPHVLDLRTHGPHALVGGTTGSGKSEMLQSWILGLAAAHSPQRVTFLLVDYKGGSAFSECRHLPHTVGLVTDLSPHLVRRALTSLTAELRFRETLLARKRKKDLDELERTGDPETPPSLVIVVDEFAALVHEVPEFVDGVVNVAQRGRSLGLHLILATQRPAGVIKDNLRANTNLRVALRVADEHDSIDVVGTPQAFAFDPGTPGRAVVKSGPGRLVSFQAAYAGGWTTDEPPKPAVSIQELTLGGGRTWEEPAAEEADERDPGPTDIVRVVQTVRAATDVAGIAPPRKPWLPPLDATYDLAKLPMPRRDDELVFGKGDDPLQQDQPAVAFHPDVDGNLLVYGTGGSGKSGLLRTIAVSAGITFHGGACQIYGLDFGARGLDMLEELPHVGSIIQGTDTERVGRLLTALRDLVEERAARYARSKAGSITEYRALADEPYEPRVLLLVDGVGAFRQAYESADRIRHFEMLQTIATDGRPVGVHVVMTADRPGAVTSALSAVVQRRVVLRLAGEHDYATLGESGDVLRDDSPPGRGLVNGTEVQVAVLGGTANTLRQAQAIAHLAETMRQSGISDAPPIERLADVVPLQTLPATVDDEPVFALSGSTLRPVSFASRGTFLVTGPPGSGRTTALWTLVGALLRARPEAEVHVVTGPRSPLTRMPGTASVATTPDDAALLATQLLARVTAEDATAVALVVEGVPDFAMTPADAPLQQLAKALTIHGGFVLGEAEVSAAGAGGGLLQLLRNGRTGLALQAEQSDGPIFRTEFPRLRRAEQPVGRGLHVANGRTAVVQVALPAVERRHAPAPR